MIDELAAGIFGLGGALVGGFTSWAATRAQFRHQQRQSDIERARHLDDQRRSTFVTFLSRADIVMSLVKEIAVNESPRSVQEPTMARYHVAWDEFVVSLAGVQVIGPSDVSSAAMHLRDRSASAANIVDQWIKDGRWPDTTQLAFETAAKEREKSRERFVSLAEQYSSQVIPRPR